MFNPQNGLVLMAVALIAAVLTFAGNWLALIPWRRARGRHWTERARVYHPVRVAAMANTWVVPAVLTMTILLIGRDESPHWALVALVASIGAVVGTIPMEREVCPRIPLNDLLRQVSVSWLIRFLMWFVFIAAIALMPQEFNLQAALIGAVVFALCIVWNRDGWIGLARHLQLYVPAPERLQRIVEKTAAKMIVPLPEVWLLRISVAQAFAIPGSGKLLFTERLVELLSDDEIAAVCAHELGHLTEHWSEYYRRYMAWLTFLPWIFFKPTIHTLGVAGCCMLMLITILAASLFRRVSHKLELRADKIAHSHEPETGTYARALARIYEDNLLPAVHAKEDNTHPHLYDRLIAAGITPDYPRPAAARSMALHGRVLASALGLVVAALIIRSFLSPENQTIAAIRRFSEPLNVRFTVDK